MAKKKGFHQISQKDFDVVKTLLNMGLKVQKVVDVTGRSVSTVQYIRRSATLEDYKTIVKNNYSTKKVVEPAQTALEFDEKGEHMVVLRKLENIEAKLDQLLQRPVA